MDKIILNSEQKKAVEYEGGPLLIIAGAGTGKTTVITERIKWLIFRGRAKPSEIVALTFTEKAAYEMEERIDKAMPYGYIQMWIATFHSFCDRILRQEAVSIGVDPGYRLITETEVVRFIRDNLFKFDLSYFRPLGNPHKFITSLLQHFSRLKDEDISPQEYFIWAENQRSKIKDQKEGNEELIESEKYLELAKAYKVYEELKVKDGFCDFADLISLTLKLFRERKNILRNYQNQFKYILVDEFQDTNIAQYELIKLLAPAKNNPNLTVVGDDNQSIYKFRGAAVSNILSFKNDYPKAEMVVLNKNYRSTQEILDYAYRLIKYNDPDTLEARLGISKKLTSERKIKGEKIEFIYTSRVEDESEKVAEVIKNLAEKEKYQWSDFAVLVRANNHAEPFTRAFVRKGIPYQFLGPGMLLKQPEIKNLTAYLKTLFNPQDSTSFYKILTWDLFAIPAYDLTSIVVYSRRYNLSLFEAVRFLVSHWFGKKDLGAYGRMLPIVEEETKEKLKKITSIIERHLKLVPHETAGQILYYFLEDSGLLQKLTTYDTEKEEQQAQNISKFFDKLKTYEIEHEDASVSAVCDWLDLSLELGESPLASDTDWTKNNAVNILTVHSSKGLEFPVVFLVNLVMQRFPTLERREKIPIPDNLIKEVLPTGDYHLEEERRLFYVGVTRAKDRLFLTASDYYGEGKRIKKLSPFVFEILGTKKIDNAKREEKQNQLSLFSWQRENQESKPKSKLLVSYLSYSQIQTFEQCPLHYKLKYILKIPTPPTASLSFGSTIHATLRDYYQWLILGNKPDFSLLLSFYEKNWLAEGFSSKKHEQLTREKGENYLKDYFEKSLKEKILPVALEIPFKFPVEKNLNFGGKIDRVDKLPDGRIEIIDYKTGEKLPTQKEVDRNLQLTLYALAATRVYEPPFWKKPEEIILSLYYFEEQRKISTVRTGEELEEARKKIVAVAQEIENSDFKCHGGESCRNCEYKLYCETR